METLNIDQVVMQAGYAGILLYLTFRIFKVLDQLVALVKDVQVTVHIHNPAPATEQEQQPS